MTPTELFVERFQAEMDALLDQVLFGTGVVETWIDEDGQQRHKCIPIIDFRFNFKTGDFSHENPD